MKEIGERISKRRKDLGYSQEELAVLVGMTRGSIGNYESGINLPSFEALIKIASALACYFQCPYWDALV